MAGEVLLSLPGPLVRARFLRRYKRFFLEAQAEGGDTLLSHCPNSGSMAGLLVPSAPVLLTDKGPNFSGKLRYGWQAVQVDGTWVGINTILANRLAEKLLEKGLVSGLPPYISWRREVPYGLEKSKIDFLLEGPEGKPCYLEVKSVTLKVGNQAQFPDAVTQRGQKHLRELMALKAQGLEAALLFLVQRDDVLSFAPARDFDPAYANLLEEARKQGVGIHVLALHLDQQGQYFLRGLVPQQ